MKSNKRVEIIDWLASIEVPPRTALIDRLVELTDALELIRGNALLRPDDAVALRILKRIHDRADAALGEK